MELCSKLINSQFKFKRKVCDTSKYIFAKQTYSMDNWIMCLHFIDLLLTQASITYKLILKCIYK